MPVMTNIQRQPNVGMIRRPPNAEKNKAELVIADSAEPHRPRCSGGTNSESVTYPTTISAPSPTPMTNRAAMSQSIDGAAAPASEAKPKISRLSWYEERRP